MTRYTVTLIVTRQLTLWALNPEAAALIATEVATDRWPDCGQWLVSDVEEEA